MKLKLTALMLLFSNVAFANDYLRPQYELSMKPAKAESVVLPSVGFVSTKVDSLDNRTDTGTRVGVEYLTNKTGNWTYGTRVSYLDFGRKSENSKGLNDIEFVAKNQKTYKNETILYGATGYWSPDKARINGSGTNNFSGGFAFEPYAALVQKYKNAKLTFSLAFTKNLERNLVYDVGRTSTLGKITGGDVATASVAYDYFYKDNTLGVSATTFGTNSSIYQMGGNSQRIEASNAFKGEVYWMGYVRPGVKFVPSLQYVEFKNPSASNVSGTQLNLAYLKTY